MKVLVTGGAGYIGSIVTLHLLEAGHEVTVIDDLSRGHRDAIPSGVRYIEANIADIGTHFSSADNIEAVLHFAGFLAAGESVLQPEIYWHNNVTNTLAMLDAMRTLNIKKCIFSSSAAVYGNPATLPITEESPTAPTNPYGMTKLAIDMAIGSECVAHGMSAASLRYFNVAGAYGQHGERHLPETHIIPLALATAAGQRAQFSVFGDDYPTKDGTCIRDYIHVADLARAHVLALASLTPGTHAIYNLGNGEGFSNKEVLAVVEKVTGRSIPHRIEARREGDPAILIASSEKAQRMLGWKPEKPSLEEIIQDAWDFFQFQGTTL